MPDDLHIPTAAGGHAYRASYRARPQGGDGMTRNLLIAAAVLGSVLLVGMGGWALLGRRPAEVPVIEADARPVRVKPENAGGMQVAGADDQAGGEAGAQGMAPRAEAPAPQALRAQMQSSAPAQPLPPQGQLAAVPQATPGSGASPLPDTPRPATRAGAGISAPVVAPSAVALARPAPAASAAAPAVSVAAPAASAAALVAGPTLVQLAAVDSEPAAQVEWLRLSKRMPDILGDRRLVLQRADRDGKAVWRIRTGGFADMAEATAFCTRLRAKGASCTIAAF